MAETYPNATIASYARVSHISQRDRSMLYASWILTTAAELLDRWCELAHHLAPDPKPHTESWVDQLAEIALRIVSQPYREHNRPSSDAETIAQLDEVAARLANRGVDATRNGPRVPLPRTLKTPKWDGTDRYQLAVGLDQLRGWKLEIDSPCSPAIRVITNGIGGLVRLASDVNAGYYGNPFPSC